MRNSYISKGIYLFVTLCVLQVLAACSTSKVLVPNESANTSGPVAKDSKTSDSASNSGLSANCINPYYPVGENVKRNYHIKYAGGMFPDHDYTESFTDLKGDNFVVKTEFKEIVSRVNWRCTADGLLATQYNNSMDFTKSGAKATVETVKSEGVSLPSAARWNPGEKWSAKYDITQTVKMPSGETAGEGGGTVSQSYEVIGIENIKTTAGTFQAIKLKMTLAIDLTIKVKGVSVPASTSLDSTVWFAKDVGMVKSETSMNGQEMASLELTSYQK